MTFTPNVHTFNNTSNSDSCKRKVTSGTTHCHTKAVTTQWKSWAIADGWKQQCSKDVSAPLGKSQRHALKLKQGDYCAFLKHLEFNKSTNQYIHTYMNNAKQGTKTYPSNTAVSTSMTCCWQCQRPLCFRWRTNRGEGYWKEASTEVCDERKSIYIYIYIIYSMYTCCRCHNPTPTEHKARILSSHGCASSNATPKVGAAVWLALKWQ